MRDVLTGERTQAIDGGRDRSALVSLLALYRERRQLESALSRLGHTSDALLAAESAKVDRSLEVHLERRAYLDELIANHERLAFDVTKEGAPAPVAELQALFDHDTPECEIFNMLRTKLEALDADAAMRCFGVVSASPGEGKTTVAIALALTMARQSNQRVLLVEADMRHPAIERYLGLARRVGLGDWLADPRAAVPLRQVESLGMTLLTAGHRRSDPSRELATADMTELIEATRYAFDVVILDCPPPTPMPDSVILSRLLDGFLLVVRSRHAPREQLAAALGNLKPDSIRGILLNDHREILPRSLVSGRSGYRRR